MVPPPHSPCTSTSAPDYRCQEGPNTNTTTTLQLFVSLLCVCGARAHPESSAATDTSARRPAAHRLPFRLRRPHAHIHGRWLGPPTWAMARFAAALAVRKQSQSGKGTRPLTGVNCEGLPKSKALSRPRPCHRQPVIKASAQIAPTAWQLPAPARSLVQPTTTASAQT